MGECDKDMHCHHSLSLQAAQPRVASLRSMFVWGRLCSQASSLVFLVRTHVLCLCMPTQTYTMPTIRASTSPTYTATIPLVHLPIPRPTAQPSTSSPQPSASPSGPNAPVIIAAAASRPARPISNLPSNTATTNLKPPSKSKSSNHPWPIAILAWIGTGLAVAGVMLTIFYGKLTMLLAHWTAGNDYRESCRNGHDDGLFLDEKCKEALGYPPKPPPIRKKEVLPLNGHHIWGVPIWILATGCVLLLLLLCKIEWPRTRTWSLALKRMRKRHSPPAKPTYPSYLRRLPWSWLSCTLLVCSYAGYYITSVNGLFKSQLEMDFREACRSDPDLGLTSECVATLGTPAPPRSIAAWKLYDTNNDILWTPSSLLLMINLVFLWISWLQVRPMV